jgi:hypothetical protein
VSRKKSYWQTAPGVVTAVAGMITAVTGLLVALHQIGIVGRDAPRTGGDATPEVRALVEQMREMREQIAVERTRLEALQASLARQPGVDRDPALAGFAQRVGELDSASGSPSPEVSRILLDPSLSDADRATLASMAILKDLDREIAEASRRVDRMPPGPSQDVEVIKLKRLIDKRAQIFDQLRAIIDKYNQTAKGIIDSIGR